MKTLSEYDQDLIEIMINNKFSDSVLDFWNKHGEKVLSKLQTLKIYLHRLVGVRNKILKTLKSIDEYMHEGGMATCYSKSDYIEIVTLYEKLHNLGYLNCHKLWGFEKKPANSDLYEDAELTE